MIIYQYQFFQDYLCIFNIYNDFLAPTALIFLFGIGIPVLIHLLNRFNVKKVNLAQYGF